MKRFLLFSIACVLCLGLLAGCNDSETGRIDGSEPSIQLPGTTPSTPTGTNPSVSSGSISTPTGSEPSSSAPGTVTTPDTGVTPSPSLTEDDASDSRDERSGSDRPDSSGGRNENDREGSGNSAD